HRLQSGAAMKKDGVHGQTLNLQRRADTLVERQAGANADLGKGFPYVLLGDPAALRQESHGLAGLDLGASITARLSAVAFLLPGDHVKLAEDLLERLHALGLEAFALPEVPGVGSAKVEGMSDAKRIALLQRLNFPPVIPKRLAIVIGITQEA